MKFFNGLNELSREKLKLYLNIPPYESVVSFFVGDRDSLSEISPDKNMLSIRYFTNKFEDFLLLSIEIDAERFFVLVFSKFLSLSEVNFTSEFGLNLGLLSESEYFKFNGMLNPQESGKNLFR